MKDVKQTSPSIRGSRSQCSVGCTRRQTRSPRRRYTLTECSTHNEQGGGLFQQLVPGRDSRCGLTLLHAESPVRPVKSPPKPPEVTFPVDVALGAEEVAVPSPSPSPSPPPWSLSWPPRAEAKAAYNPRAKRVDRRISSQFSEAVEVWREENQVKLERPKKQRRMGCQHLISKRTRFST